MKKTALLLILFIVSFSAYSQSTGCTQGDCVNGYGVYVWDSGEKYEGYWKNDKRNGYGVNNFSNGAKIYR